MTGVGAGQPPDYSFAFQPIIDARTTEVVSQEALVRGPNGEPAFSVLEPLDAPFIYEVDERLRIDAIRLACALAEQPDRLHLNLNLMPRGLEISPTAMSSTLEAAASAQLSAEAITIEITESEIIHDIAGFVAAANEMRATGVQFAIDDFGAGYAGLTLLADFQPDAIKLDRKLISEIHTSGPRQAIVRGVQRTCEDLGIDLIAEGVETEREFHWLAHEGIHLFQGYLFARPSFQQLPGFTCPQHPDALVAG